jgi:O-antigen/teichoic acid export membrane protein
VLRRHPIAAREFSPALLRSMIAFGLPLMAFEMAGVILNMGDRYVVQVLLGSKYQGIYSAAYSLCEYVEAILITALSQALTPMYTRLWAEKGESEAKNLIETVLHFYILVAIPLVAGLAIVGNDLIAELASDRYRSTVGVVPLIMSGLVCGGCIPMFGAGLFIHKRTRLVLPVVIGCAVCNVLLSKLLVPLIGLSGAALAMLFSYVLLTAGFMIGGRRHLYVKIPLTHIGKCAALAALMYLITTRLHVANVHLRLVCEISFGALLYAILAFAFDRRTREIVGIARERYLW